jgi:hypothetical protein
LNPAAIAAALNRHQVRYVIIGAFAAIAQQAPIPATRDIDFTPDASQENLARLSRALSDLGARIRTEAVPDGLPFSHDATSLAAAEVCPPHDRRAAIYGKLASGCRFINRTHILRPASS